MDMGAIAFWVTAILVFGGLYAAIEWIEDRPYRRK